MDDGRPALTEVWFEWEAMDNCKINLPLPGRPWG